MGFFTTRALALLAATAAVLVPAQAQTYTKCNPLKQTCTPDPALGGKLTIDFTAGKPSDFITSGQVTYGSNGLELSVSASNKGPYLQSQWYMMFGRVDVTMQAAPGAGVVSSFILQSDDLDEIDLEWVGDNAGLLQTNFFGKGFTGTYNRGQNYHTADASTGFHTYSIDWNAARIQWLMDGQVLRTLVPSDFPGQYPQSPMFVKFGPWAAGDPSNNPKGTVQWADGPINYADGPFPMYVQSITAADYSTGTEYKYTGRSGSWQSIQAVGGSVNPDATAASGKAHPGSSSTSPSSSASSKHRGKTTSASSKSTPTKSASSKSSSGSGSNKSSGGSGSSKPTSSKSPSGSGSNKSSGGSGSSKPTPTNGSSSNSTVTHTGAPGGFSSHTGGAASSTPTQHASGTPSPAPHSGVDSGKQVAWGLSLVCVLVGIVAAF